MPDPAGKRTQVAVSLPRNSRRLDRRVTEKTQPFAEFEASAWTRKRETRINGSKPGIGLEPTTPSLPWKCSTN
jgi:hypothetical protein